MENIKLPDGDGGVAYNVTVKADTVEIKFETPCGDFNTTTWAWLTFAEFDQIAAAVQRQRETSGRSTPASSRAS